jgi:hypothetical protein
MEIAASNTMIYKAHSARPLRSRSECARALPKYSNWYEKMAKAVHFGKKARPVLRKR